MLVAACRMLDSERPESERLISDPLARLFVDERAIAAAEADVHLQQVIPLRTRYIDDAVHQFVAAHPRAQILLLGAGLDCRAYRLTLSAPIYEVDFPDTLHYKAQAAAKAGLPEPENRIPVPVDMAHVAVPAPLEAAGFDRSRPTLVVWEGVVNYLTNDQAEAVVQQLGDLLAVGSMLVCDYVENSWFNENFQTSTETLKANLRTGGEPLKSGLHDVKATLSANGFDMIDDEAVELLPPRYGRPTKPRFYPARIFTAVKAR